MARGLAGVLAPLTAVVVGCASGAEPTRSEPVERAAPVALEVGTEPSHAPPIAESVGAPVTPPPMGRDHHSVVACATDADCGWDDACVPTRCVEARARTAASCDESAPPPGACLCFQGGCTTKPARPPAAATPCEVRGCQVDRAAGTCVADTGGVREGIRTNRGLDVGPSCDCVTPTKGCTFEWFEPVTCKSDRDCWIDPAPRPHPVSRPRNLRGRDFRPCSSDGEITPRCGDAGYCVLGPAFSC